MEENKRIEDLFRYTYDGAMAQAERNIKRLWIALLLSVALGIIGTFGSNIAWLAYESQFDTAMYSQDGDGLNNFNTGMQGDVAYGAEGEAQG